MKDIHVGGRPPIVRPEGFYEALLVEYETMSTVQMAKARGVSRPTISKWLKIAREKRDAANVNKESE